jgi:hypothetical protein
MRRVPTTFLAAACLLAAACSRVDRVKQARTFADMQTLAGNIEELRRQTPDAPRDTPRMRRLISGTAEGRDAWGHEYLFLAEPAQVGSSYVLISLGSDGKADVADPREYFRLPESVIHDEPWKDIVFRDGRAVTRAGK